MLFILKNYTLANHFYRYKIAISASYKKCTNNNVANNELQLDKRASPITILGFCGVFCRIQYFFMGEQYKRVVSCHTIASCHTKTSTSGIATPELEVRAFLSSAGRESSTS